ncbi:C1 family peptidase [Christiangramia sp. SM2212]|uniref:C1 family peptidase n=1 Tax=Christiangramia sediminicola TaxID=3073267 RepID=A0ABU1EL12_9FLAO|nr:C1 family peptidase [Christiangramia sp. SM2212]MDR5589072.1 C1 family peptidase [Christiangramia sp. SM2212]
MRKNYLLYFILFVFMSSCYQDRDDFLPDQIDDGGIVDDDMIDTGDDDNTDDDSEEEPDETNQFITDEGLVFYTGLECVGSGDYIIDRNNVLENLEIPETLADSLDLSQYLPPIGDQGKQGSCTAWAVSYYMKSFQEILENGLPIDSTNIKSPAYTYNQITQGNCEGTVIEDHLKILKQQGVSSIKAFPYDDNTCREQPEEEIMELAADAKISDYKSLSGENMVEEMKTLLTQQTPIIIAAVLTKQFAKKDSFNLSAYREHNVEYTNPSCHAMLVVGYNDRYEAFKVVNSWGKNWGDEGFVWIDYKAFENVLKEDEAFRVINSAVIAYDE